jgi:hypothetical protein
MEGGRIRKKSNEVIGILPEVPEIPCDSKKSSPKSDNESIYSSLYGFKDREASFYKALNENIKLIDGDGKETSRSAETSSETVSNRSVCEEECREYITPLMNRTQGSISALLATRDSLDQLDNLHRIIQQLLTVQEQNYQMRKRLRTVKTLHVLKEMEIQVSFHNSKSNLNPPCRVIEIYFNLNFTTLVSCLISRKR